MVFPHFLPTHAEDAETWPVMASQVKPKLDYGSMKEALEKTWTSHRYVPSLGSFAGQMVTVMDIGDVRNCTL